MGVTPSTPYTKGGEKIMATPVDFRKVRVSSKSKLFERAVTGLTALALEYAGITDLNTAVDQHLLKAEKLDSGELQMTFVLGQAPVRLKIPSRNWNLV
jgi:hypothetical protein